MANKVFTGDEIISDIMLALPMAQEIFAAYGLSCASCTINTMETLKGGVNLHGMTSEEFQQLLEDLNEAATEMSVMTLKEKVVLTDIAYKKLIEYQETESADGWGLKIDISHEAGSDPDYFLDFTPTPEPGDHICVIRGIKLFASPKTLRFLQTRSIDFEDDENGFGFTFPLRSITL